MYEQGNASSYLFLTLHDKKPSYYVLIGCQVILNRACV